MEDPHESITDVQDWLDVRNVQDHIPPHFICFKVQDNKKNNALLSEWIYTNVAGRYAFGHDVSLSATANSKARVYLQSVVAFEDKQDATLFALSFFDYPIIRGTI